MNDFKRIVLTLRRAIPYLSFTLLIIAYLVSGIVMGAFLEPYFDGITGGKFLAYSIPMVFQAIRGTIVFFNQMNPEKPGYSSIGIGAATFMFFLSMYDAFSMYQEGRIAWAVCLSVIGLMIAGYIIEILIVQQVTEFTNRQVITDEKARKAVIDYHMQMQNYKSLMDQLNGFSESANIIGHVTVKDGDLQRVLPTQQPAPTPTPSQAIPDFENQKIPIDNLPVPEWAFDYKEPTDEKNKERLEDYYKGLHEESQKRIKEELANRKIRLNGLGK